jgi:plasmid stabilization system protein ParE
MKKHYTHSFVPKAEEEYLKSLTWYADNVSITLARRFRVEVQNSLAAICKNPEAWQKDEDDERFRRFVVKTFPFKIVYAIQKDKRNVLIIAIASTRRESGYWQDRVD